MQIAVLVDCFRLAVASAYNSLRLVFEIDSYATVFCFNVNECYEMFREHRMCNTSYFNFDTAVIKSCNNIPTAKTTQFNTLNVYDILNAEKLVMTVDAVKKLEEVYA